MKLSMIDWTLLSRTALLIGASQSSFSEEAAVAGRVLNLQMRTGGHVLGYDISVPNCRFLSDLSVGQAVQLLACASFTAAWGVTGVYC
jgi:hypothetical protein